MEQTLPSSNLFSHPGKLLEDHLIGVAKLSSIFLSEKPKDIVIRLSEILQLCCLFHDIGKATSFFQNYLSNPETEKKTEYTQHSFLSSIIGLFFSQVLNDKNKAFWVYFLIRNHHRNFLNPLDTLTVDKDDINLLFEQTKSIDAQKLQIVLSKLAEYYPKIRELVLKFDISTLFYFFENLENIFYSLKKTVKQSLETSTLENYLLLNLAGSILLDADKSEVTLSEANLFTERNDLPGDCVDKYLSKIKDSTSTINSLRDKAYLEIVSKIDNVLNNRILSIDLPTGLGKTFASFSFALKLRSKLGNMPRIIYCLPFLSIIEQNYFALSKVLKYNDVNTTSDVILKHHHLGELIYRSTNEAHEHDTDVSRILIEGWNSEIIVTTFYQLFHSLITNSNKNLRKFHRFSNSIIILDEIQAIPIKYWKVLQEIFQELANKLNTYIILVTATQPLIFNQDQIASLCNAQSYFNYLNRIKLIPNLTPRTIDEFVENFAFDGRKTLFVLNTISSAKKLFSLIKNKVHSCTFLSTHIPPSTRQERILDIRKGKYDVVVSTQLIEAGVDLDFDIVIRDIAPFDSIVQSAGRCNRNSKSFGYVYVVNLVENGKSFAGYIYDPILLEITKKILENCDQIEEPELYRLSTIYFEETNKKKTQYVSDLLLRALRKLHYSSEDEESFSISSFRIIEDDYPKLDVFIEVDDNAEQLWKSFLQIINLKNRFERKKEFDRIRSDFYNYVISIPKNASNRPEDFVGELGYVPKHKLDTYYDFEIGYKLKDEQNCVFI